ncbi:TPA: hypothetical protein ACODJW_004736 [Salmonella enterica subsp. enterica serovar Muenchen]
MLDVDQEQSDAFWAEVLHRAEMQLSNINVGGFTRWRRIVGNSKIHKLLQLMELLLHPDNNENEIAFIINYINNRLNGTLLFACFKKSGKILIKKGMAGDKYCMPVLYVIIRHLMNFITDNPSENCRQESIKDSIFIPEHLHISLKEYE